MKQQFAIRPTIRNNKDFKRDDVIKTVAAAVGPGHKVDLHGYDLLIFVEIYKVRKVFVLYNDDHPLFSVIDIVTDRFLERHRDERCRP